MYFTFFNWRSYKFPFIVWALFSDKFRQRIGSLWGAHHTAGDPTSEEKTKKSAQFSYSMTKKMSKNRRRSWTLTVVWARDEPQAAVVDGGVLQGDPEPQNSAQRLGVQKGGVLVWRHYGARTNLLHAINIQLIRSARNKLVLVLLENTNKCKIYFIR